ncbi:NitT/TauT family transport system substrate-binding protein [Roseimicrobium gellanilyticum]|uniref:NitT/TauT family transport system substrate-binding protein n=1 Tax=Roseimicrobium gellanilyticum TaxID=748857 RepID=A0A366H7C7_9BACT|nr:NrtA/SsuA/CpmA family ABC transporter substrate-binding protein [Roseimicrobium gellanilyticum]RBP36890.1 NitT/TauT family transport system substrate-binding protein [Roseimicrobium gellanilyticum]
MVAIAAWWWRTRDAAAASAGDLVVRVAYAPVVLNLPSYVAQDRGLFEKAGVKVVYTSFSSANDMINALVAGQVDAVTGVSMVPVLNLEAQSPGKARVFLHSMMTKDTPYDGMVVKKGSPIKGLTDLAGKKVGVFPGTTAASLLKATFKKHGIDANTVQLVPLPPPSHLSALESGAVDALLAYEPTLSTALDQGAQQIFGSIFADLLSPSPISCSVVSRKFATEHPEAFARFVGALDESIAMIRANPSECRKMLQLHTKISEQVAQKVNLVPDVTSTETKSDTVQAFVNLLFTIGEMQKKIEAPPLLAP